MSSQPDGVKEVKKKGRYVASRYMQAAENFSQSNPLKDRSVLPSRYKVNHSASPHLLDSNNPKYDCSYMSKNKQATSTPICNNPLSVKDISSIPSYSGFFPSQLSAIDDNNGTLCENKRIDPFHKPKIVSTTNVPVISQKSKKLQLRDKHFEDQMDILYAQYLQAAYLKCQARTSLESNSKLALEKIHKVWSLIQCILRKDKSIQKYLSIVQCLLQNHAHLQKKEQMLKPLIDIIPTLEKEYEGIAKAVEAVKHQLQVKNVLLDLGDQGEISKYLHKIDSLLKNILSSVSNVDEVNSFAVNFDSFTTDGELVVTEIKRCLEILAKLRNLILSEASLALDVV